jgi:hypothetical protein
MSSVGLRILALLILGTCLLVARFSAPARAENPTPEQFSAAQDHLGQSVAHLAAVGEITGMPAPVLIATPAPEPGILGGVRGRPLGMTLFGLSVLCLCAVGPVLIIMVVMGVVIRTNRQKPMVY